LTIWSEVEVPFLAKIDHLEWGFDPQHYFTGPRRMLCASQTPAGSH
jgi:hypothetical protein